MNYDKGIEHERLSAYLKEAIHCLSRGIRSEHVAAELQSFADNLRQPVAESEAYRLNSEKNVAVANSYRLRKDMPSCPRGVKVLLLGAGGSLVIGQYLGEEFWHQWSPLPKRSD